MESHIVVTEDAYIIFDKGLVFIIAYLTLVNYRPIFTMTILLTCTVDTDPIATVMLLDNKRPIISQEHNVSTFSEEFSHLKCEQ